MALGEQVRIDLKQAMKQGDKVRVSTLRLLQAALKNREIDKGGVLEDSEIIEVLMHAAKQRREAIALAREYGREDVAQQEGCELAILETYLPEALGIEELQQRIETVVQDLGAVSPKDMGRVMQVLMPELKGRADGRTVSRLVRERLEASP
jgi:uncharacterized protein YqeY